MGAPTGGRFGKSRLSYFTKPLTRVTLSPGQQIRCLFVQTQPTPNPKSKKLLPGKPVLEEGTMDFQNRDEAKKSPLVRRIFAVKGVEGVFLGTDFLSVTLEDEDMWPVVQADVFTAIREFYEDGKPILDDPATQPNDAGTAILEGDDSTVCLIKDLIETRIRPTVQEDGGDIAYRGFSNSIVYVELRGSCVGCPSSSVTLKQGVQNMLMHYVPEVMGVEEMGPDDTMREEDGKHETVVDKSHFDRLKDLGF